MESKCLLYFKDNIGNFGGENLLFWLSVHTKVYISQERTQEFFKGVGSTIMFGFEGWDPPFKWNSTLKMLFLPYFNIC
jgi:hypothetical protein